MSALLAKDGVTIPCFPQNGERFTWQELQFHVGKTARVVMLGDINALVYDNEAKVKGKPVNRLGTDWLRLVVANDYVCGPAMLVNRKMLPEEV